MSFKIQTVCQFSYEDGNNGKDNEKYNIANGLVRIEDYDNEDIRASRAFVSSKGADSSLISLDDTLQSQKDEVYAKIIQKIDSYGINRVEQIIIVLYQTKKSRGSSYIPTPPPYNNSRCGLINIKNEDDDKCFYWCMKYHSSKQENKNDRLTVLKKLKDTYNYEGVNYPASYDDIKIFEENNKIGVVVYAIDEQNSIIKEYHGNKEYLLNERIYLLRIEDKEKSHFVYIKHIHRLLNKNTHISGVCKIMCPYCEK